MATRPRAAERLLRQAEERQLSLRFGILAVIVLLAAGVLAALTTGIPFFGGNGSSPNGVQAHPLATATTMPTATATNVPTAQPTVAPTATAAPTLVPTITPVPAITAVPLITPSPQPSPTTLPTPTTPPTPTMQPTPTPTTPQEATPSPAG